MSDASVVGRALSESWAAEVSGVAYYEALAQRFPDRRREFEALAVVERTTRDLVEAVARRHGVSIDHRTAERVGVEVAQSGNDWREVLENALSYTPDTLRMYENLASVLPEHESVLARAIVEHERAQIVLFESVAAGEPADWSAIDAYLERHGAGRPSERA
jgi:rubrerythrin